MQTHILTEWFNHFLKYGKPTIDYPVLLILDGHATHVKNIDLIEKARQNHTTVVCLPPHCSHKLQPLDVSFMGPFNTFYVQAIEKYLRNNPGRVVSQFQVSSLLGEAFLRAAMPSTAINGFRKCGIVPLDPSVFSDVNFVAAEVTDVPLDAEVEGLVEHESEGRVDKDGGEYLNITNHGHTATEAENSAAGSHPEETLNKAALQEKVNDPLPSTSFAVSPSEIFSLPKSAISKRKTNRKRGKAAIVTSSPFKAELVDEKAKKQQEEERKKERKTMKSLQVKNKTSKRMKKQTKTRRKLLEQNFESDEDSDAECFYCNESYSKSVNEGWIRCSGCHK